MYALFALGVGMLVWFGRALGDGMEKEKRKGKQNGSAMANGNGHGHVLKSKPIANGSLRSSSQTPVATQYHPFLIGLLALTTCLLGTLLVPNTVALFLDKLLGRGMSWYANEYSVILLFAPAALLGLSFSHRSAGMVVLISSPQVLSSPNSSSLPTFSQTKPETKTKQWNEQHSTPSSSSNRSPH